MNECIVVMYDRHKDTFEELNHRNPLPLSGAKKLVFELREIDIKNGEYDRYFYLLRNAEHYPPTAEPQARRSKKKTFYQRHKDTIEVFIGGTCLGLFLIMLICGLPLLVP